MMVMLISGLLDLPMGLWKTFSVEQKFGFNRTDIKTYVIDLLKSALLSTVLIAPLLAAVFWLMDTAGGLWWLYTWLVWLGFSLLLTWAYPVFIAPLFNRFKQLDDVRCAIASARCWSALNSPGMIFGSWMGRAARPIAMLTSPALAVTNASSFSIP